MKPVDQDQFGKPDGNCFTACVASILEVPLTALRDVQELYRKGFLYWENYPSPDREGIWARIWDELADRIAYRYGKLPISLPAKRGWEPDGPYVAAGPGPRGVDHCVVYQDGRLIHDPHPDRSGLTGEPEEIIFLVPVRTRVTR